MDTTISPHGMHHVSSLSADATKNHAFYTGVMGLRLVKKSVNQDAPDMYHLFYADARGTPGTDMTFFEMPHAARWKMGNRSISRVGMRIAGDESLDYWMDRLNDHGVFTHGVAMRDGRKVLDFEDPEGHPVSLIDDGGHGEAHPWSQSPVPAEYQIRGLGYDILTVPTLAPTEKFLTEALNMRRVRGYQNPDAPDTEVHVFEMGEGGPDAEVHVAVRRELEPMRYGAGGVHHLALRIPDENAQRFWIERLNKKGYRNSGPVDRYYFKSIYVREPNGILFELATDGPGFAVDEDSSALGQRLALPPFLETQRAEIESHLHPIGV